MKPPQIMGRSPKILRVFRDIKKIARQEKPALISGEDGTCKQIVAKAIHYYSSRHNGPFIVVNLAAIPSDLMEAELFGDEKTILHANRKKRKGKLREADKGTLFIEEVSEMDIGLQERLLGFLINKECIPAVCGPDIRIICATSWNLKEGIENGKIIKGFQDVFHEAQITIPPLRERQEDILPLVQYFLQQYGEKFETGPKVLSKEAKDYLMKYDWPHNVRELEHIIKRAAILSHDRIIGRNDLLIEDITPCSIKEFLEDKLKRYLKEMTRLGNCNLYDAVLSEVEKSLITIVLQETGGNQLKAAKTLGINRNTLRTKIKEYKIRL